MSLTPAAEKSLAGAAAFFPGLDELVFEIPSYLAGGGGYQLRERIPRPVERHLECFQYLPFHVDADSIKRTGRNFNPDKIANLICKLRHCLNTFSIILSPKLSRF